MLGFSLYFENKENISKNLEKYRDYDIFFTSLHYPASDEIFELFMDLYKDARDLGLDICVDINNQTLKKHPELRDMGLILRLDFGFSVEEIKELSEKTRLAINASTVNKKELSFLKDGGVRMENIIGWHNYYPLDLSGLGREFFIKQNELIRSFGMKAAAFVPGNKDLRGPVFKGLPSLEDHRYQNPYLSFIDLKRNYDIDICLTAEKVENLDEVFIKDFAKNDIISLPVSLKEAYRDLDHMDVRPDISPYIIRNNRVKKDIKPEVSSFIHRGDILICNNLSGRYAGEVEIARADLGILEDRNVIGKIDRAYVDLVDFIEGADKIVFNRK